MVVGAYVGAAVVVGWYVGSWVVVGGYVVVGRYVGDGDGTTGDAVGETVESGTGSCVGGDDGTGGVGILIGVPPNDGKITNCVDTSSSELSSPFSSSLTSSVISFSRTTSPSTAALLSSHPMV